MPLNAIPTGKKYTTRILGAALAVLSIVGYNLWFRATYGPQTSGNALPDFRILSLFDGQVVTLEKQGRQGYLRCCQTRRKLGGNTAVA
jgi:hypothetical protein